MGGLFDRLDGLDGRIIVNRRVFIELENKSVLN